ncbi:hypothetical protein J2Y54_000529 [Sphingomonas sp. BE123]|uniref:hypothetical protein n=1 Tax=Sphingomonas sp. BE123 TaxID=2817842 RepID=UPI0028635C1B|nr:hypothetical protein [Sphingomonas sp. BE123]MDR6851036.1 hypothetical protein [Sphingomonas sp. BE123]
MSAEKAKRTLLGIEIPRDELAFRIAQRCLGLNAPAGTNATDALNNMNMHPGAGNGMGEGFRSAADAAVLYFYECINAGRQPS